MGDKNTSDNISLDKLNDYVLSQTPNRPPSTLSINKHMTATTINTHMLNLYLPTITHFEPLLSLLGDTQGSNCILHG